MPDVPTNNPEQFYQGAPVLSVPDVPTTAAFYRKMLGFRSDPGAETPEYTVVWRDNAAVHLAKGALVPTGVRIFFWVKDVNALYEEVIKRGAPSKFRSRRVPIGFATFPFATRTVSWWCLGKTGTKPGQSSLWPRLETSSDARVIDLPSPPHTG